MVPTAEEEEVQSLTWYAAVQARAEEEELRAERMAALRDGGRRYDSLEGLEACAYQEGFAAGLWVAAQLAREQS